MTTEQYSIGYEAGYQEGWNDAQKPQRTWVGLTDEDINSVRYKRDWTAPWTDTTFARAIEAKLRSKNYD